MSNLLSQLSEQFKSKSQYQKFVAESEKKFDINPYRFQHMTVAMTKKFYNQLKEKYKNGTLEHAPRSWHENERKLFVWTLMALIKKNHEQHIEKSKEQWEALAECFFGKDVLFVKYQFNAIQKNRNREKWTQEQDQVILKCEELRKKNNWNEIAKEIFFATDGERFKGSKQCRQRWQNHLDSHVKHDEWALEEDYIILNYVKCFGKKWSKIVEELYSTRTEHMVKNRFKSLTFRNNSNKAEEDKLINKLLKDIEKELSEKKDSVDMKEELKDVVVKEEQLPELPVMAPKRSNYGKIERVNGEFIESASPVPFLFKESSPVTLPNPLFLSSSISTPYSSLTPQPMSLDSPAGTGMFTNQCRGWGSMFKRDSFRSNGSFVSDNTERLFDWKNDSNFRLSQELNEINTGEKVQLNSPMVDLLEGFLFSKTPHPQYDSCIYKSQQDSKEEKGEDNGPEQKQVEKQEGCKSEN